MYSAVLNITYSLSLGSEVEFASSQKLKRSRNDAFEEENSCRDRDKKFKSDNIYRDKVMEDHTQNEPELNRSKCGAGEMNLEDIHSSVQVNQREQFSPLTLSKSDPVSSLLADYPFVNNFPDLNVVHEVDDSQDHEVEDENSASQDQENNDVEEPLNVADVSSSTLRPSESEQYISSRVSSELDTIVYSDRTSSEYIPMLSKYMRNQTPLSFWDVEL